MTSTSGHETDKHDHDQQPQKGPFTASRKTTYKISAIEFSVNTEDASSHVPPKPCGCGGAKSEDLSAKLDAVVEMLRAVGAQILQAVMAERGPASNEH